VCHRRLHSPFMSPHRCAGCSSPAFVLARLFGTSPAHATITVTRLANPLDQMLDTYTRARAHTHALTHTLTHSPTPTHPHPHTHTHTHTHNNRMCMVLRCKALAQRSPKQAQPLASSLAAGLRGILSGHGCGGYVRSTILPVPSPLCVVMSVGTAHTGHQAHTHTHTHAHTHTHTHVQVAADRFGRRPTIVLSLAAQCVCTLAFAYATSVSIPAATAARFLGGALNGAVPIAKTYVSEITDSTNQVR
jgi:hypothetical protein